MIDKAALREELYNVLISSLEIIGKSHNYEETKRKHKELCEKINARLEAADALCVDAERYIDKATGKIKENIGITLDPVTEEMLRELGGLVLVLELFAKDEHWDDDLMNSLSAVLAICDYESVEKKIIAELGLFEGRKLILETKKSVLPIDEELGLHFFHDQVARLDGLLRTMTLFAKDGALKLESRDNLDMYEVTLVNLFGEHLLYLTSSKITYEGRIYIELERLESMKAPAFAYYFTESHGQGHILTLVEDKELEKKLDKLRDRLEAMG